MFQSTKTYGHEQGLSCAFRQWRADSHCNLVHGYALSFKLTFTCETLDANNWVMDFGGLKEVKAWLKHMFDHTLAVAYDDPHLTYFEELDDMKLCDIRIVPATGCEAFSKQVYDWVANWLTQNNPRVTLVSVECREHAGNSALWIKDE